MDVGGFEEVYSADDVGDSLEGVVVDDGEVVAGGYVFADDDGVTEALGIALLGAFEGVVPVGGSVEVGEGPV